MTRLRGRVFRLEAHKAPVAASDACAIVREIVQPGATGPELLAMMLRPPRGGDPVRLDRAPGETEAETRTRFAAMCSPDQRMKGV